MSTCENCKYWEGPKNEVGAPSHRLCRNQKFQEEHKKEHGMQGDVYTHPQFTCSYHEPK